LQAASVKGATKTTIKISSNPIEDKGKRNIVENPKVEEICKMIEDISLRNHLCNGRK